MTSPTGRRSTSPNMQSLNPSTPEGRAMKEALRRAVDNDLPTVASAAATAAEARMMSYPRTIMERVHFRLIQMPCCGHLFCNVNPRLPSYCPECGKHQTDVKSGVRISDGDATLTFKEVLP